MVRRCSLADAAFAGADEVEQVKHLRQFWQLRFDSCERIGNGQSFAEQNLVALLERGLRGFRNAVALEANLVDLWYIVFCYTIKVADFRQYYYIGICNYYFVVWI